MSSYIKVLFSVTVWGASFIATKIALNEMSPASIVWLRFLFGLIVLFLIVIIRKQLILPEKKEMIYFATLGFLGITFHQWLQSTGLITAKASTTAWIVATTPIFMALLGWLVLKERLGLSRTIGILLAGFGVLLVVSDGDIGIIGSGDFGTPGDFLILMSALNWAIFSAFSKRGLQKHPPARMLFYVMLFGWLFSSVAYLYSGDYVEFASLSQDSWIAIGFLGFACSGVAYIFWYDALKKISSAQAGVFLYLEPIVAVILASYLLSEPFLVTSIIGGLIIIFGVWIVNRV